MREILFRGQTRRYGEKIRIGDGEKMPSKWVYGGIFPGTGDFSVIYGAETEEFTGADIEKHTVYSYTVGQYTGLKDKNGKRIFEGDILGSRYDFLYPDDVAVEVVKWICNGWAIQEGDRPPTLLEEDEIMPYSEVIGNVHDNKELWGGNEL